jgi:hypothetical protein
VGGGGRSRTARGRGIRGDRHKLQAHIPIQHLSKIKFIIYLKVLTNEKSGGLKTILFDSSRFKGTWQ